MKTGRLLFGVVLLAALLSCGRAKLGFCPSASLEQRFVSALSLMVLFSQIHDMEWFVP